MKTCYIEEVQVGNIVSLPASLLPNRERVIIVENTRTPDDQVLIKCYIRRSHYREYKVFGLPVGTPVLYHN